MKQSDIDPIHFVFRNIFKGLFWTAIGGLIAAWVIIFVFFFSGAFLPYAFENSNLLNVIGGVFYILFETTMFAIMGFVILGIPVMILPCTISILMLTVWLYQDAKVNKLSFKGARIKGAIFGGLAGIASLFMPMKFFLWPYLWMSFINEKDTYILFWVILISIPVAGVITGNYFGKLLFKELEPKSDYFSIDWEALQKEQQEDDDLTPDSSTHDI